MTTNFPDLPIPTLKSTHPLFLKLEQAIITPELVKTADDLKAYCMYQSLVFDTPKTLQKIQLTFFYNCDILYIKKEGCT